MFFLRELPTRMMIDKYVAEAGTGDTDVIAQTLSMLRKASQLGRQLDAYFSVQNLSQLKFLILVVIDREPDTDRLRQSEVNQRLDVSKPVLHRTVMAMLDAGLLERSEDLNDARAHKLSLTEAGKTTLKAILPGYFQMISDFSQVSE